MLFIKKFKKQKTEETNEMIVDSNLPDVRKIEVPDLKQYLVNGYKEIREVKKKNEELQNRDSENKEKISDLNKKMENKNQEIKQLNDIINTYRIREKEINEMEDRFKSTMEKTEKETERKIKDNLIRMIINTKGNISKNRLCDLIENKDLLEKASD